MLNKYILTMLTFIQSYSKIQKTQNPMADKTFYRFNCQTI
jgi:hypothetical protein